MRMIQWKEFIIKWFHWCRPLFSLLRWIRSLHYRRKDHFPFPQMDSFLSLSNRCVASPYLVLSSSSLDLPCPFTSLPLSSLYLPYVVDVISLSSSTTNPLPLPLPSLFHSHSISDTWKISHWITLCILMHRFICSLVIQSIYIIYAWIRLNQWWLWMVWDDS